MNEAKRRLPELRFSEFSGEWGFKKLSNLTSRKINKNKGSIERFILTNSATKGIISQQDYFDKDIANQNNLEGYYVVDIDDFVYNPRISISAPVGPIKRNNLVKGAMSPLYSVFAFEQGNKDFFELYFESTFWHKYMKSIANYGARHDRMNITNAGFFEMPLPFPSTKEQQKVAGFLSAVGKKITQLTEKHCLLSEYKKGVMQQIFTQQTRFKDDQKNSYPEWKETKAGCLFYSHSNKNHNSDLPILAATQDRGVIPRSETGLDIYSSDASVASYKIIEPGDFMISLRSFQGGIEYSEYLGIGSPAYTVLKPKKNIVNNFYKFYFKKEDFISRLSNTVVGIRDGKQISYSAFATLKLPYPCIDEQQKIANFLTEIDRKIDQNYSILEQTKTFKKGLLQKMFA